LPVDEEFPSIRREQFTFCDRCGKKVPVSQIGGKCITCGKMICTNCMVASGGRIYCKEHAPPPPQTGGGWGCFIATAAYGTPLATEIQTLRNFRDRRLDKNRFGKKLVALYYEMSPGIAKTISLSQLRRKIVRILLYPIVEFFKRLGY
jgi:hypothetical protein